MTNQKLIILEPTGNPSSKALKQVQYSTPVANMVYDIVYKPTLPLIIHNVTKSLNDAKILSIIHIVHIFPQCHKKYN